MSRRMFFTLSFLYIFSLICGIILISRKSSGKPGEIQSGMFSKGAVAVVQIYGPISISHNYPSLGFSQDADKIIRKLHKLANKQNVKAVVLRINSPGGSVAAVQEICREVNNLKKAKKIVVASIGDIAASGGYYIASQSDKIIANPGSLTGSIGAKFELTNMQELLGKIGLKFDSITSGKYKDIGSPYRAITQDEKSILQNIVDDTYSQFVEAVAQGRKMDIAKVKELSDGRIFSGSQAKALGLVDEMGNIEDAISQAAKMAGITSDPKVLLDYDSDSILGLLSYFGEFANIGSITNLSFKY